MAGDRKFGENRHVAIFDLETVHLIGETRAQSFKDLALFAAAFDQHDDVGVVAFDFACHRLAR